MCQCPNCGEVLDAEFLDSTDSSTIEKAYRAMADGRIDEAADLLSEVFPELGSFTRQKNIAAAIAAGRAKEAAHAHS